ncbi:hypothetical protein HDV03_000144 [Kappamyces sp. JEL0829]|nr:hypothetical protein HDV03_000144 [Kappamyces sp. JEL0829]
MKQPETTVVIIRHAEKLEWHQGQEPSADHRAAYVDNHKLSPKGYERAAALPAYFLKRKEMADILARRPLGLVIAQDVDFQAGWGMSERPRETIWPLMQHSPSDQDAALIHSPLELRLFTKSQLQHVSQVIQDPKYRNKTIIVSWCHQQMRDMLISLGVPNPPKWPKGRYDITWVVDLSLDPPTVVPYAQALMFGDSPVV